MFKRFISIGSLTLAMILFSYSFHIEASEKEPLYSILKEPLDPLFKAAKAGNVAELKQLLKEGANPNQKDKRGETPLMHAVQSLNPDAVKFLIDNGANVKSSSNQRITALMFASMGKDILFLLSRKEVDNTGDTRLEIAKILINSKANFNARGNEGASALMMAVGSGNVEVAELLIESGANLNIKNQIGMSPLFSAIGRRDSEVVRLLLSKGADPDPDAIGHLALALSTHDFESFELIVGHGVNLNRHTKSGSTLLIFALKNKLPAQAKLLLKNGMDINFKTKEGKTPLIYFSKKGDKASFKFLVEHDADLNAQDNLGNSALHYATKSDHVEIVATLLENGAKANLKNKKGQTPYNVTRDRKIFDLLNEYKNR